MTREDVRVVALELVVSIITTLIDNDAFNLEAASEDFQLEKEIVKSARVFENYIINGNNYASSKS